MSALRLSTPARPAGGLQSLLELVPLVVPAIAERRPAVDRLEAIERELLQLLASSAPSTWSTSHRPLTRILRAARREMRAIARSSGDVE